MNQPNSSGRFQTKASRNWAGSIFRRLHQSRRLSDETFIDEITVAMIAEGLARHSHHRSAVLHNVTGLHANIGRNVDIPQEIITKFLVQALNEDVEAASLGIRDSISYDEWVADMMSAEQIDQILLLRLTTQETWNAQSRSHDIEHPVSRIRLQTIAEALEKELLTYDELFELIGIDAILRHIPATRKDSLLRVLLSTHVVGKSAVDRQDIFGTIQLPVLIEYLPTEILVKILNEIPNDPIAQAAAEIVTALTETESAKEPTEMNWGEDEGGEVAVSSQESEEDEDEDDGEPDEAAVQMSNGESDDVLGEEDFRDSSLPSPPAS